MLPLYLSSLVVATECCSKHDLGVGKIKVQIHNVFLKFYKSARVFKRNRNKRGTYAQWSDSSLQFWLLKMLYGPEKKPLKKYLFA